MATTLRELGGMPRTAAPIADSVLVLIDCQNTYTRGPMELDGVQAALDQAEELLARARDAGIPVLHIAHDDGPDGLYDINGESGQIVSRVAPRDGEPTIVKHYPNAFVETELHDRLSALSARNVVLAGFMTHMCVNSTARGAFNLGYAPTVVAAATATRALPGPDGEIPAAALQAASLAALGDLFAVVVAKPSDIAE